MINKRALELAALIEADLESPPGPPIWDEFTSFDWRLIAAILREHKAGMTYHVVLNDAKTEGIVTLDPGVAHEARKGAESNCFDRNGKQSYLAQAFCELYSVREDATRYEIQIDLEQGK